MCIEKGALVNVQPVERNQRGVKRIISRFMEKAKRREIRSGRSERKE